MTSWNGRWRFPLYLRIWLAVVVAVGLLTIAFGWLWRMNSEQQAPLREVIVRDERTR
jgi:two-component system OmpR family sensor kinase